MGTDSREEAYDRLLTGLLSRVLDMLRFAEAKNAALLAFASAWIAGMVNLLSSGRPLSPSYHSAFLAALPVFIISASLAIASFLPKLQISAFTGGLKTNHKNLLFFGDIAKLPAKDFVEDIRRAYLQTNDGTPTAAYLSDLEEQISVNSKIAQRKHYMFRVAAASALLGIIVLSLPALWASISGIVCWMGR